MMGNALKQLIEASTEDANIRGLNQRLGDIAEAMFILAERNGAPVQGSCLNRYFARTIGGIAGVQGGAVGSLAGAITADKLADIIQDPNVRTWAWDEAYREAEDLRTEDRRRRGRGDLQAPGSRASHEEGTPRVVLHRESAL
jgi:hypothetical protein